MWGYYTLAVCVKVHIFEAVYGFDQLFLTSTRFGRAWRCASITNNCQLLGGLRQEVIFMAVSENPITPPPTPPPPHTHTRHMWFRT
jgi:hypothetical protein